MTTTTPTRVALRGTMSQRLKVSRNIAGLSIRQMAEATGMSKRAVAYYEDPDYTGNRKAVYVRAWAQACARDFEELWGTKEQPLARTGWLRATAA